MSLGNVLAAGYGSGEKPATFIKSSDQIIFKTLKGEAFEVQVGIHELLGHGSGKLYHAGTADAARLVESGMPHPLKDGESISGPFYEPGATWDSTFGKIASAYEECRAECCGLYLVRFSFLFFSFLYFLLLTPPPPPSPVFVILNGLRVVRRPYRAVDLRAPI